MSDDNSTKDPEDIPAQDELTLLKDRCKQVGLQFHPSISLDKLKEKYAAFMDDDEKSEPTETLQEKADKIVPKGESARAKRQRLRKEAARLVRVRIACMDPNKKDYEGEVFTVSNSIVGTFRRYVPFNADDGWHVEKIILDHMKEKVCQVFVTRKDDKGNKVKQPKQIKAFSIEILDPLTPAELDKLADRQKMAGTVA